MVFDQLTQPAGLEGLEQRIRAAIERLTLEVLSRLFQEYEHRLTHVLLVNGGRVEVEN